MTGFGGEVTGGEVTGGDVAGGDVAGGEVAAGEVARGAFGLFVGVGSIELSGTIVDCSTWESLVGTVLLTVLVTRDPTAELLVSPFLRSNIKSAPTPKPTSRATTPNKINLRLSLVESSEATSSGSGLPSSSGSSVRSSMVVSLV
jgi:hypothetical protein